MSKSRLRSLPDRPLEYREEPEQPYWPSFIEKLLLSIIDAHPVDSRPGAMRAGDLNRQKRLEDALDALFGASERRGNRHIYLLHAAVAASRKEMPAASAAAFEQAMLPDLPAELKTVPKSKRSAFSESTTLIRGNSDAARQQRLTRFEREHRRYLQDAVIFRHLSEEEDMLRDLTAIARILARWNLPCSIDSEALGLASLWGSKSDDLKPRTEDE